MLNWPAGTMNSWNDFVSIIEVIEISVEVSDLAAVAVFDHKLIPTVSVTILEIILPAATRRTYTVHRG